MAENDIVRGLFGPTPYEVEQQQREKAYADSRAYGMMTHQARNIANERNTGYEIGQTLGKMVGYVDPERQKAQKVQDLLRNSDLTSQQGLRDAARMANQMGLSDTALQLSHESDALSKKQADLDLLRAQTENQRTMSERDYAAEKRHAEKLSQCGIKATTLGYVPNTNAFNNFVMACQAQDDTVKGTKVLVPGAMTANVSPTQYRPTTTNTDSTKPTATITNPSLPQIVMGGPGGRTAYAVNKGETGTSIATPVIGGSSIGSDLPTLRQEMKEAAVAEKQKIKDDARKSFGQSIDSLIADYTELTRLGGIVNTANDGLPNAVSRIQSSGVGQFVGGVFGTEEQTLRDNIKGTIPLLILDIKNVTGASAQQMNSNVELENFKRAASDPKTSIQTVLKLLKNLKKKYNIDEAPQPEASGITDSSNMPQLPAGFRLRK